MAFTLRIHWPDGSIDEKRITDTFNVNSNGCLVAKTAGGRTIELSPTTAWEVVGEAE